MARFGSVYGGWNVIPAAVSPDSVVYSFGVGEDISFDVEMMRTFGLCVHAFDPTPKSIRWVEAQDLSGHFIFHEYGLAAFDGEARFHPPDNPNHVSHTILEKKLAKEEAIVLPVKRLGSIMAELRHERIDILKMDIEGAEYQVIEDLCETGILPAQILVEFHHRFPKVGVGATKKAVARLRSIGYLLFSVSASGQEYSFVHATSLAT